MTYTGQTQVDGPPDVRHLGLLTLSKLTVGPLRNNVYLLQGAAGSRVLVDAADHAEAIIAALLPDHHLDRIVTTHRHQDHWGALADIVAATGATTVASAGDAGGIGVATDQQVNHGDVIDLDGTALTVIELRGHTPAGPALAWRDDTGRAHLITGDSLFPGGIGRTTDDTFDELLNDVVTRVFDVFDDDTWIYPGHGSDTTLGAERPHLAQWRDRRW